MDLTHAFTVPTSVEETWSHFQDIAALAECFPGAQVTSAEDDTFQGTCKVKLGPIALVYTGSGTFTERDDAAHRFVVDAKGRDKRGNGTAGATVTVTMAPVGDATQVEVVTDLAITGKPAQFGRGVMQDVSDKLLGQFVACLEQRLAPEEAGGGGGDVEDAAEPVDRADQDAAPASVPAGAVAQVPGRATGPAVPPTARHAAGPASGDDVVDLGAALLPVLLKSYGRKVGLAVGGLVGLWLLVRLLRR